VQDPKFFRPAEVDLLVADPSKARERLGWQPTWDLAQGLAATVEWYAGDDDPRERTLAQIRSF
jgi:GDPmannose 4,6-dehydratase